MKQRTKRKTAKKLKNLKYMGEKKMSIKIEDLFVKEIIKTTKDKDDGIDTIYKAVLEQQGSDEFKVVITSSNPIKLAQGDKGLKLELKTTQTTLPLPGKKK